MWQTLFQALRERRHLDLRSSLFRQGRWIHTQYGQWPTHQRSKLINVKSKVLFEVREQLLLMGREHQKRPSRRWPLNLGPGKSWRVHGPRVTRAQGVRRATGEEAGSTSQGDLDFILWVVESLWAFVSRAWHLSVLKGSLAELWIGQGDPRVDCYNYLRGNREHLK